MLFCQKEDIGRAAFRSLSPERVADGFASSLLMPEYLFRPIVRRFTRIDFGAVEKIADVFDTSRTATAIRLVEAKYFVGCVVCHGLQGRKWFTLSPEVPDRWFPRQDLSSGSFAFDILFGGAAEDRFPRKVGADAWFDRWEAERYDVHEQTIRVGDAEILTLVRMDDPAMLQW
jgi:hypothetical protein